MIKKENKSTCYYAVCILLLQMYGIPHMEIFLTK